MAERAVHLSISGRVQGVGYRAWLAREAIGRSLSGWVRNRMDGSVEAVVSGEAEAVDALVAHCRQGPPASRVSDVKSEPYEATVSRGFRMLPTA